MTVLLYFWSYKWDPNLLNDSVNHIHFWFAQNHSFLIHWINNSLIINWPITITIVEFTVYCAIPLQSSVTCFLYYERHYDSHGLFLSTLTCSLGHQHKLSSSCDSPEQTAYSGSFSSPSSGSVPLPKETRQFN